MTIQELRAKTSLELTNLLAESRRALVDLRMKVAVGQLKDVREIRETRKTIAQILTIFTGQKKSS